MNKPRPIPDVKIVHVMADGTRLDSIEGKVIPPSATEFYDAVVKILRDRQRRIAEEKLKGESQCPADSNMTAKQAV